MRNIFVISDNIYMYQNIKAIIKNRNNVIAKYYCSKSSSALFEYEIKNNNIEIINIKNSVDFLTKEFDLGISCHSKQIFPKHLVNKILCINIHPGYNPYNRGWFPQAFCIINKLPVGATIHIMDELIDHGSIISQEEINIYSYDTSYSLYNRILDKELELLDRYFDMIVSDRIVSVKPIKEGNYNSIKDFKNLCKINLDKKVTMKEAIDYLRALSHKPYKNAYFLDENENKVYVSIRLEVEEKQHN